MSIPFAIFCLIAALYFCSYLMVIELRGIAIAIRKSMRIRLKRRTAKPLNLLRGALLEECRDMVFIELERKASKGEKYDPVVDEALVLSHDNPRRAEA